jgi:FAD/FMN-containing dehydrogenase
VWLVRPANEDECSAVRVNDGKAVSHGDVSTSLNDAVNARVRDIGRDTKSSDRHEAQFRTVDRFKDFETVSGYLPALLSKGIAVPQINCEVGIPLAQSSAALAELLDWSESERHPFHYPFIVRATGPSAAWLSAAYERETCHIGLAIYRAADGSVPVDSLNHLGSVQEILSRRDGLPHWGKYFDPSKFELARTKNWDAFHALRQELDPSSKLLNPMVRSILEG